MIIIGAVIVLLLGTLITVVQLQNRQASEGNPYEKDNLHPETVDQLDDENYDNQILPRELNEKINNGEDLTVYFYSPTCIHCQNTTPILAPLAEDMGVDMKKLNLLEFENAWGEYGIESTPTLVHYEDGEEVKRIVGSQPEENFEAFFNEYVLDETK